MNKLLLTLCGACVLLCVAVVSTDATFLTIGRFDYTYDNKDSISTQARWKWQGLQADQWITPTVPQLRAAGVTDLIAYANPVVYNPSEPTGIRTCVAPSTVQQSWILLDSNGNQITRSNNGGEYFLDPANTAYQSAAVSFLVAKCQNNGWNGVILDEINEDPTWSYSTRPAKYPTNASYQSALLSFVTAVANGLHNAGYSAYINYGGNYDSWAETVTLKSDGACSQYWVGTEGSGENTASLANGEWNPDLNWATWCEGQGKRCIYHASTSVASVADYALGSFLLVSQGHGIFCAAVNDDLDDVWTSNFNTALQLGTPLGAYTVSGSTYTRQFTNGHVTVNPTTLTATFTLN